MLYSKGHTSFPERESSAAWSRSDLWRRRRGVPGLTHRAGRNGLLVGLVRCSSRGSVVSQKIPSMEAIVGSAGVDANSVKRPKAGYVWCKYLQHFRASLARIG